MPQRTTVDIGGTTLSLSNLEKVLYPGTGFTKGEVVDYYARIAPVLLPHLADRALTRIRYPDGVDAGAFFEKNAPRATPEWVRKVRLPSPGSGKGRDEIDYVVVDGLPTLVWLANLAALELHVPQWTVGPRGAVHKPDLVVIDLDPGAPATVVECCRVALLLREVLEEAGLQAWAKTSGSKGMQLYIPIEPASAERTSAYARGLAEQLERAHPDLVVSRMRKDLRPGKVLLDWSQNNAAKTTVAPYSLRARERHWVSTPIEWDEVAACRRPEDLQFVAGEVLDRVQAYGDLMAPLRELRQSLPRQGS